MHAYNNYMKKKERKNKELFFETVDIVFVDHY